MTFISAALLALSFAASPARHAPQPRLEEILAHQAEYCRKLEAAALDFVCLEDIEEIVNRSKDIKLDQATSIDTKRDGVWIRSKAAIPPGKVKRNFLYDYQFVRKGGLIKETRILLRENGKRKREENAKLKTLSFVFQNALLGPVAVFGEQWRAAYEYRISGEDTIRDRPVIIIDVTPKASSPATRSLFGRAFIDRETLDILKIEWNEARVGNPEVFESRGERYKMKPRISLVSEFGIEKNGVHFPSSLYIEEAYLNEKGKAFVRSETSVIYKDFRFFNVAIEEVKTK